MIFSKTYPSQQAQPSTSIVKTLVILVAVSIGLSACGVGGLFSSKKKDDKPRLEGERISIIELQTKLEPDTQEYIAPYSVPDPWKNEFWPQQGGYPNHAMHNPSLGPSPLGRLFNISIGQGSTKRLPLSAEPIILNGKIFSLDTRGDVKAFDAQNGQRLWTKNVQKKGEDDDVIGGGLAGSRGKIYITNGYDELLKMDADSGEIEWRQPLPSAARAAPSVLAGRVFVSTLANEIIAMAASDGRILWSHQAIGETSGLFGAPAPAVNRDVVVPGYSSGELFALRIENGGIAWQDNLTGQQFLGGIEALADIQAAPILDRGLVIAMSYGGKIVAIDQRTGRRVWERDIGGSETPWVAGDSIFVLSAENQLISLERVTGNIRWIKDLPKFEAKSDNKKPLILFGPSMGGGRLFITSSDSTVFEINPNDGSDLIHWDARENLAGPAIIANDILYMLSDNGRLLAFR